MLARNVSAEGRSRAFAGGASVPVSVLAELAEPLVAVHGQSDQHRLLRRGRSATRWTGSRGSGSPSRWPATSPSASRLLEVEAELTDVTRAARERAREADLLRFGLDEIAAVEPLPGRGRRAGGRGGPARVRRHAAGRRRAGPRGAVERPGEPDALAATAEARTALESVREHDTEAGELADRLAELTYLLSDLAADVASYASRLETDPSRLARVSERRAALTALTRKYGDTIAEVLGWAEQSAARLLDLDDTDGRIERLREQAADLRADLAAAATELTGARAKAATRLGAQVSEELTQLAMPRRARRASWCASTRSSPSRPARCWSASAGCGSARPGVDEVELQLAANTGSAARPIAKGASGGELSRVMLAIEVALAGTSPVPTFVFDEVDAGVGGRAAVEVGRRLAELAKSAQVLVVTHLPQVAAYADRHVVVEKSSDGTVTTPAYRARPRRPRARAVADVRRHGRVRHRAGPRPRAPRDSGPGPRPLLIPRRDTPHRLREPTPPG